MENKDTNEIPGISNQELFEIMLDLSRKINDIHRLHFSEEHLSTRKLQKRKYLAEILTSPARKSKKI
jgi:hypothetical protein